jgi:23S rRNA pseudouridine1911/1915/1917 synthase
MLRPEDFAGEKFASLVSFAPMEELFAIIAEDSDLLVINKPAGLVCHPTKADAYSSLIGRIRLYLGPDIRPQLINRLDRETSGVTLVAKNEATARQIRRLWEQRQVRKEYLAIVHGHPDLDHCLIEASIGKDEASRVAIKDCVRPDGAWARTEFQVQQRFSRVIPALGASPAPEQPFSLLRVHAETGRKHQIRIHLAHAGHPIVGDKLYGGDEDLYLALVEDRLTPDQRGRLILPHQALHAREVCFFWQERELMFRAPAEPWFTAFANGRTGESLPGDHHFARPDASIHRRIRLKR